MPGVHVNKERHHPVKDDAFYNLHYSLVQWPHPAVSANYIFLANVSDASPQMR